MERKRESEISVISVTSENPSSFRLFRFLFRAFILCAPIIINFPINGKPQPRQPRVGRKYTTLERLEPERLRAVREERLRYQSSRKTPTLITGFEDYRAIMHAHAEDSSHTGGTRSELLTAAKQAGVRIILLSDHVRPPRDFISQSWHGIREGVLFIPGAESEGFIVHPTRSIISSYTNKNWKTRDGYIRLVKQDGGLIFLSHVEEKLDWGTAELDGLEIYNHHTDFMDEGEFVLWLRGSFTNPERLKRVQQILTEFPMEVFGASQDYLSQIIAKWDRDLEVQSLTGIAANDCHHNQVFTINAAGPDAIVISIVGDPPRKVTAQQSPQITEMVKDRKEGDLIARLDFDPYERSLSYVTTHILLRKYNEKSVREALKQGHAYVAHDWLCDPTGFAFIAERNDKQRAIMGDQVILEKGLRLRLAAPVIGTIKLFRNGIVIGESKSDKLNFDLNEAGVYRAEVWLEIDGEQRPWIYANPIRVVNENTKQTKTKREYETNENNETNEKA